MAAGHREDAPLSIGPWTSPTSTSSGSSSRRQGLFWLLWLLVALTALAGQEHRAVAGPGRAMQAIRDRDVAAEVVGVSLARYKVGAFAVSSAFAAVAGGLLRRRAAVREPGRLRRRGPGLVLSIPFIAVIIIGRHRDDLGLPSSAPSSWSRCPA